MKNYHIILKRDSKVLKLLGSRRGSILISSVILMTILSFSLVTFLMYEISVGRINERKREQLRAFFIAEAGVHKVVHWFNHPEDYLPDQNQFAPFESTESYYDESDLTRFENILTIPEYMLPEINDERDDAFGKVVEITIYPSEATDPVPSLCKIKSVGETLDGNRKTSIMFVEASPNINAKSPGAVVSGAGAAWGGQFNVHWGEIWSETDVHLPNLAQTEKAFRADEWLKLRTEGTVFLDNGNYADGTQQGSTEPLQPEDPNYYQPWQPPDVLSDIYQHQEIDMPSYSYERFKKFAQRNGRYYTTDHDANIYRDGVEDEAHKITNFYDEFDVADPVNDPYEFVFIDTTDGNPPADDGSNLTTLNLSGDSPHTKGVLFIAANVYLGGSGSPPNVPNALDPNLNTVELTKVRHQGLFYVSGTLEQSGENTIYGSVISGEGFGSGGCPQVYYDFRIEDGSLFRIQSIVAVHLWNSY